MQHAPKKVLLLIVMTAMHGMLAQKPVLVKDGTVPTKLLGIQNLTGCNGILYFVGNDQNGPSQLYRSNGTDEGTHMVKEIVNKNWPADAGYPEYLTEVNNLLFFKQFDSIGDIKRLWVSDGTEAGTRVVKKISTNNWQGMQSHISFRNRLFFSIETADHGYEMWQSDGSEEGTFLLKDINPGTAGSYPSHFMIMGNELFFFANDKTHGTELWKTDGTIEGTVLVKDINEGPGSSDLYYPRPTARIYYNSLSVLNGYLYFSASDGIHGQEPWRTDGTAAGTRLIKDVYPGPKSSMPAYFTPYNGIIYFSATDTSHANGIYYHVYNTELYRTNGTEKATFMVKDINQNNLFGSGASNLVVCNNKLFFLAMETSAVNSGLFGDFKIYTSDGTGEGTSVLIDYCPRSCESGSWDIAKVNNVIYFGHYDTTNGYELWKTNGYADGTKMVADLEPGPETSNPSQFTTVGTDLYFTTATDTKTNKLWKLDISEDLINPPQQLLVFPNPFESRIELDIPHYTGGLINLELYDCIGRRIYAGQIQDGPHISLKNMDVLSPGIYILHIEYDNQKFTKKMVKAD